MNDWWVSSVQKVKSLQNLSTPVFQNFHVDFLESFDVPEKNASA